MDDLCKDMQAYIAVTTVGPSILCNQGAAGVIPAAQEFLKTLEVSRFSANEEQDFIAVLDAVTGGIEVTAPIPGATPSS